MNKTAIKNFAIWARNKLIADITYKAGLLGITEKEIKNALPQSIQTVQFFDIGTNDPYSITGVRIQQRRKLADEILNKASQSDYKTAYKNVVEEVAYTWFNRLIAVRFMEVNDYLPTRIRVLSSESRNKLEPDLVTNPFDADLDYTPYEKDRIMQLKNDNQLDELFRMLFIKQCNALNAILPELFEKTNDYTELLMNVSFTDQDGVVCRLVNDIPEDDFNVSKEGQVEIIGWMYQYYNTEPKDETFALLKKNVKITKDRIPSATQLFTPHWIVRYMVENSLGRLWLEGHPNNSLKSKWKYYLDEAEQEPDVQKQLDKIREEYKTLKPEEIKVIDPCMGSGHILVYAFDLLMQIYESYGYSQRNAAKSIIENNLYGLDIDNRAYQLAYFSVTMKARQYNRRILNGETTCHVYAIQESNGINREQLKYFGAGMNEIEKNTAKLQLQELLDTFVDAKEYGSILNVENYNWDLLYRFVSDIDMSDQLVLDAMGIEDTKEQLRTIVEVDAVMAQKYDVVVTNPPYMGSSGMDNKLSDFARYNYPYTKSDMSTICMEKYLSMCKVNGLVAMINIPVWMFLSSYEQLRKAIINNNSILNMVHFGRGIFGSDFGTTAFVIACRQVANYIASYCKLFEKQGAVESVEQKEQLFLGHKAIYFLKQEYFLQIPGIPIAYWISVSAIENFSKGVSVDMLSDFTGSQHKTADNERYLRYFWEIAADEIHRKNWIFYIKGGEFRKWYGNIELVVDWREPALSFYKSNTTSNMIKEKYCFAEGITYTSLTSASNGFRYLPPCGVFDIKGPSLVRVQHLNYCLGFFNSKVSNMYLNLLNPTITLQVKDVKNTPILIDTEQEPAINSIVQQNISISKCDWNAFETSWDFVKHPLLLGTNYIAESFKQWQQLTNERFDHLKANEEDLNRIFIKIYGLQNELTSDVEDSDVTIRKADLSRDIRSFISYAIGCMFGRYSLDVEGLVYAGGEWDDSKYSTFIPDKDNILPITDEEYFEDDVVGLFCAFLKKSFGAETLEENLDFIANALGNKGNSSREAIRNYFLKDFFKDHCKIYQKRPIYWLFDSGKADGFKALIYMHRYNEDTIGKLRIDYLHRMQRIYESEISRMQETIENSKETRDVNTAMKRKEKLVKQLKETKEYDEKIAHLALARISIDLDDGVKVNYQKVQTDTDGRELDVLAKI